MPASSNCSNRPLRKTPEEAALLRLSAADLAYHQNAAARRKSCSKCPWMLKPAQQIFASTLAAELAMTRNQPKAA
jgi:outer membrane PBP1 activator LpoA protein